MLSFNIKKIKLQLNKLLLNYYQNLLPSYINLSAKQYMFIKSNQNFLFKNSELLSKKR